MSSEAAIDKKEAFEICLKCLDATLLKDKLEKNDVEAFCSKIIASNIDVAAICIPAYFIPLVKRMLSDTKIKIATVINFPTGSNHIQQVLCELEKAIDDGADEIDYVFNYQTFLAGDEKTARSNLGDVRKACSSQKILKVILESGCYPNSDSIGRASELAILEGADFIKTSTGKTEIGATLQALHAICPAIEKYSSQKSIGLKLSGGMTNFAKTFQFIQNAGQYFPKSYFKPASFRIGASSLFDELLVLNQRQ